VVGDGGTSFFAHAHTILNSQISGNAIANSFLNSTANGNVIANIISNCNISGNANYNSSTNCTVGGVETFPTIVPSDPASLVNPISEANINMWKSDAIYIGTITTGNLVPNNNDVIGPGIVEGNLIIESGKTVYLGGNIYVKGNITVENGSSLKLGIVYGNNGSGVILSDGWIYLDNNSVVNFPRFGNGHLMLLSLSKCDRYYGWVTCTSNNASIDVMNNVDVDILASPYGKIRLNNNVKVVSLVGDQLSLHNNVILNYEQGLTNMNFSSGPSGSWSVESWREVE
jgi:hypothetical protein